MISVIAQDFKDHAMMRCLIKKSVRNKDRDSKKLTASSAYSRQVMLALRANVNARRPSMVHIDGGRRGGV